MYHVLTIAGSDSCAGAGIQADLKTISALGAYGLSVITSVTAQNTRGVTGIQEMKPRFIQDQLEAVFTDIRVDAVKIGMLGSSAAIKAVAEYLAPLKLQIVLDPVMASKSGHRLLEPSAINALKDMMLPLATVITPNLPEAEELLGSPVRTLEEMEEACRRLLDLGTPWVVVKGGHLEGSPVDVVGHGDNIFHLVNSRVTGSNNHGTGCTFSSAIAVGIARGFEYPRAISRARAYVQEALENGFAIGQGTGVLDHFTGYRIREGELC